MWLTSQITMKNSVKLFTRHDNTNTALEWRAIHRPIRVPGGKDNGTHTHIERHHGNIRRWYIIKIITGPNVRNNYLRSVLSNDITKRSKFKPHLKNVRLQQKRKDNHFFFFSKHCFSKYTNNSNKDRSSF